MGASDAPQTGVFRRAALPRLLALIQNWNAQGTKIRDMGEIAPQGLKEYQQRGIMGFVR